MIAASSKNVDFDQLSERQKEDLKIAANQFSHIGLRDKATLNLFERLLGNDNRIKYVPDPTFTFDIDYSYVERYLKNGIYAFNINQYLYNFWKRHLAE